MNAVQRKIKILDVLREQGSVEVEQLTDLFGVSKVTVRGDLDDMERRGLLIRTHGGAMLPENRDLVRLLANTLQEHREEKYAICRRALQFIEPGMSIIIDAGSTTVHLAKMISTMPLTVITNSVLVLQELMNCETVELLVAGGILRKPSLSFMGSFASSVFDQIHADILFLGISGFSIKKGMTCTNLVEAETKKHMIHSASKVVLLADSSKLEKMFIAQVCGWDSVDYLVTDALAEDLKKELDTFGVTTVIA